MLLKFPLAFGATILLTTVAADRDLLFFANTCATTCDDNSGNFLMYRTSADGATCRTRCSAGMWTFFLRLLGWGCGDCPDMIMQGIDHAEGFFCDEASEDLITLNRDPANLDYPRYQVHPVLADKCFLRLTPDEPVLKNRAVSAFEPLEFHAANPQHSFSAVIDYRAYGNKGQDGSGMTFVIQKDARDAKALGEDDNGLGVYGHDYTNSFHNAQIRPALVVELRSFINTFNDHHIRIVTIGADNEVTELAQSKFKYRTDEGSKGRLWIDYCGDGLLKVFIDRDDRDGVAKPGLPQLTTAFNLATFFGPATDDEDKFFVGFTSSTGTLPSDNHDVLSWYMRQTC